MEKSSIEELHLIAEQQQTMMELILIMIMSKENKQLENEKLQRVEPRAMFVCREQTGYKSEQQSIWRPCFLLLSPNDNIE